MSLIKKNPKLVKWRHYIRLNIGSVNFQYTHIYEIITYLSNLKKLYICKYMYFQEICIKYYNICVNIIKIIETKLEKNDNVYFKLEKKLNYFSTFF